MNPIYRPATLADRVGWVAMRCELWPDCPVGRRELEMEQLCAGAGVVVLAEVGKDLAGFAEISIRADHVEGTTAAPVPYLEGWYVRPEHRQRGIGAGLLRYVEEWAMERGFGELASDAELENTLSIRLHGRLGFKEVGRSVHFVKSLDSSGER